MKSASIGALRVNLGLNSAQFSKGMNNASRKLDRFSQIAKRSLLAVGAAGIAAAAGLAIAVKRSIDHADALSKSAQAIGISVEALSRLEWAARLSGVSFDQLNTGVKKLSQNMFEMSEGRGAQAAASFAALGVSVTNANGELRSSSEVINEISDKFAMMEDGAQKTALAMNIFGRAGATMIPMLNQGSAALANMADESDRLGNTIGTRTAQAAEKFNDSVTRMQAVLGGISNKIMEAVLPTLNSLIGTLSAPEFATAMQDFAIMAINVANGIAQAFIEAHKAFKAFMDYVNPQVMKDGRSTRETFPMAYGNAMGQLENSLNNRSRGLGSSFALEGFDFSSFQTFYDDAGRSIGGGGGGAGGTGGGLGSAIASANDNAIDLVDGLGEVTNAAQNMAETLAGSFHGIGSEITGIITGAGTMGDKLTGVLNTVLDRIGALGDKLIDMALDQMISGLFSNLMGAFGGGFAGAGNFNIGGLSMYSSGGYTGGGALGTAAGIVHGQEYVLNASATRNIGVPALNAMNSGANLPANTNAAVGDGGDVSLTLNISVDGGADAKQFALQIKDEIMATIPQAIRRSRNDPYNMSAVG